MRFNLNPEYFFTSYQYVTNYACIIHDAPDSQRVNYLLIIFLQKIQSIYPLKPNDFNSIEDECTRQCCHENYQQLTQQKN
jgi:hypothetical protein